MNQNKDKLDLRQLFINIIFGVVAFVLNFGMGFFITPYITEQFGSEAYGFINLANDFTSYMTLMSIAINSMASRFLVLERTRGNLENAKRYYSSITVANIILTIFLCVPSCIFVLFLEHFLDVPEIIIMDVKLTFAITFTGFLGNLIFSICNNCYYLTNKLSLGSIRDVIANVLRIICIIVLFVLIEPKIYYVAIGGLIATIFVTIYNVVYSKKLVPEFKVELRLFDRKKLSEVFFSGIWNSITKLSQIFSSGLDLMVTNLFIGPTEMGYLAVAKTVPGIIVTFNSVIANSFSPKMMELYAQEDIDELKRATKMAMKCIALFVTIPNAVLITMGKDFFTLWVPNQPAELICILAVLTVINSCVTGPMQPLYQIFTITNKVRQSSIVMIVYGFISILLTFLCLKYTNLGLYAVAGVSLFGSLVVSLFYHLPFSAKYIGLPWYAFSGEIAKSIVALGVQVVWGCILNDVMNCKVSWGMWILKVLIFAVIGLLINTLFILNKKERRIVLYRVLKILKRDGINEKNTDC